MRLLEKIANNIFISILITLFPFVLVIMKLLLTVLFLLIVSITAAPWLEQLFTGYNKPRRANNKNHRKQNRDKDDGQSWKEICRLMNPSGHAFPGRGPYAACPW
ncbi:hypothetical protein PV327_001314 [Microctonus hyperodae]|uniref:Uncharacterized protein n=1 Tax=Microctonus hyperodae TaxID=165561 RepID=A0AA39G7Y6_MICHY|nr:hypothetical protein PV327_001314 [Microctonus hyperodae]